MESIFHEKQEGSLCAQHCLNALLQNQYFSAVDLAQIGERLDESERVRMAEGGVATHEYQQFIQQPSNNFDDSGFFSVQVISEALSVWSLEMVLYNSSNQEAVQARADPTQMSAFICNYHQHWFSIRKLGHQWFNLNSLLSGPELISNTYLSLFLTQLQQEGYSIFIIIGSLPSCEADQLLGLVPAVQTVKPRLLTEQSSRGESSTQVKDDNDEDDLFRETLRASRAMVDNDDSALQQALKLSMEGYEYNPAFTQVSTSHTNSQKESLGDENSSGNQESVTPTPEELRQKRLAFLDRKTLPSNEEDQSKKDTSTNEKKNDPETSTETSKKKGESNEISEEELLEKAIAMSMEKN